MECKYYYLQCITPYARAVPQYCDARWIGVLRKSVSLDKMARHGTCDGVIRSARRNIRLLITQREAHLVLSTTLVPPTRTLRLLAACSSTVTRP